MVNNTVQIRVDKELAKFIMRVKYENISRGKNVSTRKITRRITKLLNTKDFIFK